MMEINGNRKRWILADTKTWLQMVLIFPSGSSAAAHQLKSVCVCVVKRNIMTFLCKAMKDSGRKWDRKGRIPSLQMTNDSDTPIRYSELWRTFVSAYRLFHKTITTFFHEKYSQWIWQFDIHIDWNHLLCIYPVRLPLYRWLTVLLKINLAIFSAPFFKKMKICLHIVLSEVRNYFKIISKFCCSDRTDRQI